MYKEQITEYTSKINELEKKVDIMTKSMMSSSCISSLAGGQTINNDTESNFSFGEDDGGGGGSAAMNQFSEREFQLALWTTKRWRYHQMTSFRVNIKSTLYSFFLVISYGSENLNKIVNSSRQIGLFHSAATGVEAKGSLNLS
jgi:hypothetical protein